MSHGTIESTVSGIPCLIEYSVYGHYEPAKTNAAPEDCYEAQYPEVDFEVLDRRGRAAPWLAKKLTASETDRIETKILEQAGEPA